MQKNKIYLIKAITKDKPLYMNYGLIENTTIKVVDKSPDNKTLFLEIIDFNRKIAISMDHLENFVLEELDAQEKENSA